MADSFDAAAFLASAKSGTASSSQVLLALRSGHVDVFLDAARAQPSLVNIKGDSDATPLHWLSYLGKTGAIQSILQLGAFIDPLATNLQSPLMWAAIQGHVPVIELLAAHGANVHLKDSLGATALILAIQVPSVTTARVFPVVCSRIHTYAQTYSYAHELPDHPHNLSAAWTLLADATFA
jgi:ankyrin repeat protein